VFAATCNTGGTFQTFFSILPAFLCTALPGDGTIPVSGRATAVATGTDAKTENVLQACRTIFPARIGFTQPQGDCGNTEKSLEIVYENVRQFSIITCNESQNCRLHVFPAEDLLQDYASLFVSNRNNITQCVEELVGFSDDPQKAIFYSLFERFEELGCLTSDSNATVELAHVVRGALKHDVIHTREFEGHINEETIAHFVQSNSNSGDIFWLYFFQIQ
jgi:hypothetical protein